MASRAMFKAVSTPIVISAPLTSLSIVDATPTTGNPEVDSAWAPASDPFPPITTIPSMRCLFRIASALSRPSGSRNSGARALPSMVPPR